VANSEPYASLKSIRTWAICTSEINAPSPMNCDAFQSLRVRRSITAAVEGWSYCQNLQVRRDPSSPLIVGARLHRISSCSCERSSPFSNGSSAIHQQLCQADQFRDTCQEEFLYRRVPAVPIIPSTLIWNGRTQGRRELYGQMLCARLVSTLPTLPRSVWLIKAVCEA
jgi:hypothetical protein